MNIQMFLFGLSVGWLGSEVIQAYRGKLKPWNLTIGYAILVSAYVMAVVNG